MGRRGSDAMRGKLRRRLASEGRPCWICVLAGRSGTIDYSLRFPHPYSFVADERVPVSKYWLGGYATPEAAALDYGNLLAAHKCCNEWRGNKTVDEVRREIARMRGGVGRPMPYRPIRPSRDWRHHRREVDDAEEQGASD